MTSDLIREIRLALAENGDSKKAEGMRAYMKSEMPYRGVQTPIRRKLFRAIFRDHPISEQSYWRDAVLELWRDAEYREERYAALDLAGAQAICRFPHFRHPANVRGDGSNGRMVGLRRRDSDASFAGAARTIPEGNVAQNEIVES